MSKRPDVPVPSKVLWQVRVTRDEDERAKALAEYLGESFSDMVRRLITSERRRLYDEGSRPPLKPRRVRNGEVRSDGT